MKFKPVIPRALAKRDVDEAIAYYLSENAPHAALDFIDALEQAYLHIGCHPASGSPTDFGYPHIPRLAADERPVTGELDCYRHTPATVCPCPDGSPGSQADPRYISRD